MAGESSRYRRRLTEGAEGPAAAGDRSDLSPATTGLMSAKIAVDDRQGTAGKKSRLLPAATKLMSGKIAAYDWQGVAGESHAFRRRQTELMSAKIASCDFGQYNQGA